MMSPEERAKQCYEDLKLLGKTQAQMLKILETHLRLSQVEILEELNAVETPS